MSAVRGRFVVFEGGDGVGKTTQVDRLTSSLLGEGHRVVRTFEPGDTRVGGSIRSLLLDPATGELSARAEALLYAADKAQHVDTVVRPALAEGAIVVCDRYVDSMLAYQGAGRVLDAGEVEWIARWATAGLRPDLTVVLDVDPRQALGGKAGLDRVEGAGRDFHVRARQFFLGAAATEPDRYLVLPARDSPDSIAAAIGTRVAALLLPATGSAAAGDGADQLPAASTGAS